MATRKKTPPVGNAGAVELTISQLESDGRIGQVDAALVAIARSAAAALDEEPGNAALLREYRQTLMALSATGGGDGDEETQTFLLAVRTPVVNAAPARAAKRGGSSGRGGRGARPAADAVATPGRRRSTRAAT